MDVVPLSFRTLRLCGVWYEENESFTLPRMLYKSLVILAIFYFTFTQTADLLLMEHDINEFTETLFFTLIFVALCLKIVNFITRRSEMIVLLRDFHNEHCKPSSEVEAKILESYSQMARKVFILIMAMALSDFASFIAMYIVKLFNNVMELPYKTYQFYDISKKEVFFTTSVIQFCTMVFSICINVSFDTMTAGFLIMITGQFELNAYRISQLRKENVGLLNDYIAHNLLVNGIVTKIQSFFIRVVIPFFLFSLLSVCSTIFQVSQHSILSFEFLGLITFAMCILFQVFLYCWFGNELKLKSKAVFNAVYNSDWILMSPQKRKILYTIMMCTKNGCTISFKGQCALTLDTFVWIIKTCYATLNLLQHMDA